jgi:hypothetical protein
MHLIASGFHTVAAKTPSQRAHLQTLPPGRIAAVHRNGKVWYVFPDAAREQIYVGNQSQFQSFRQTMQDEKMLAWQDFAVDEIGEEESSSTWLVWILD